MIRDYLHQQIVAALEEFASRKFISIVYAEDLLPNVPDTALIKTRIAVMNANFDTNVAYTYRLAHELSHILYGDADAQAVYQFSEYGKRGEELLAHRNTIKMLMSIVMPGSPFNFMSYYHIPSWLECDVIRTFNDFNAVE